MRYIGQTQGISYGTSTNSPQINLTVAPFYGATPYVNTDFTVANTYNELTPGPVTVANNITVTVANGATWTVV